MLAIAGRAELWRHGLIWVPMGLLLWFRRRKLETLPWLHVKRKPFQTVLVSSRLKGNQRNQDACRVFSVLSDRVFSSLSSLFPIIIPFLRIPCPVSPCCRTLSPQGHLTSMSWHLWKIPRERWQVRNVTLSCHWGLMHDGFLQLTFNSMNGKLVELVSACFLLAKFQLQAGA